MFISDFKFPSKNPNCPICESVNLTRFNSYKHFCYSCNDCNGIFHFQKQDKYLFEYVLPRSILKKMLPRQAFLRLFHDIGDFNPPDFYDEYAKQCRVETTFRSSEVKQLLDQFEVAGIKIENKAVLDISGGPGFVAKYLQTICERVVVTEYSEIATKAMSETLGVKTIKFDYNSDKLNEILSEKFDIVLLRSSIIFCQNLDHLISSIRNILKPDGHVLVETILPTLGEVFWWQQMEYKFPIIFSQETIEKYFYKNGFSLMYGYREYGSYERVKLRGEGDFRKRLFTWIVDYPMVLIYYLLAPKSRIAIDQTLQHKMLCQIWRKTDFFQNNQESSYLNYQSGTYNRSIHFEYIYNGYLKK